MNRRRFMKTFFPPLETVSKIDPSIVVDPCIPGERIGPIGTLAQRDQEAASRQAKILGRKGGLKGGHARAAKLTPQQRSAIAKKGAKARWKKARQSKRSAKRASTGSPPADGSSAPR